MLLEKETPWDVVLPIFVVISIKHTHMQESDAILSFWEHKGRLKMCTRENGATIVIVTKFMSI